MKMIKSRLEDLALFGGSPAFSDKLHVGRPNIGNRQRLLERFNDILDRRWLTNSGPYVQEFEECIANMVGAKHCIAMCNGTVALEIVIRALGLKGEVIVPAFTFIATAHALRWQEITPVFCDIDPQTHNIDPRQVERLLTPLTTGIIGVHVWGEPCAVEALHEIADRHNLKLLFDAAHALGCSYKGVMIGTFGDAEVFSFHATKFVNTLEGGAVVTNNGELAAKIRLMKNFGFTWYDKVDYIGTNGKMNEVSAAMGLTSVESIDEFIAVNHGNYQQYQRELDGIPGIQLITYDETEKRNYQYIVLKIDEHKTGFSRDQLVEALHAENILARRYFYPGCHRMEPYRSFFPHAGLLLPNTERLVRQVLSLPTGMAIGSDDISTVCEIIKFFVSNSHKLKERIVRLGKGKMRVHAQ
jgi:dTDP-4-amino-4,6-dideoxygalactose transaminase